MLDSLPVASRSERERQIEKALTYVHLEGKADEFGSALNTYERRMVELAKTLVGSPKIVLLDEPGAGLRDEEVDALRQTILGINEQFGAMTLLIDHDVEMIAATCISTVVLDFGELLAFGPTAEILKDDRVKAAYLGIEEVE